MERSASERDHGSVVDAWLARSIDHDSSVQIVRLFRAALEALWARAVTTLGSVTLSAIGERVLQDSADRFGFLSAIDPHAIDDADQVDRRLAAVPRSELIEGLRFGLIELLTVIGTLTAEILSPEMHAALREVPATMPDPDVPHPAALASAAAPKVQP